MVPFKETINTKQELIEACKKGFEDYSNRRISKNDFCMYFGFTHGEAITKFYEGDYEQLLIDGGFNSGSGAYFSGGINAWKNLRDGKYVFPPFIPNAQKPNMMVPLPLQQIFYGAPGTGKSHIIKKQTEGKSVVRTTFHPDSDYSTFVGCYKPTTKEIEMRDVTGKVIVEHGQPVTENRIIYQFVEQAFLQAYIKSWKFYAEAEDGAAPKKQFLIIEEINRGNCAQIFGDLFQLLDRNDSGFSEYFIHADKDMQKHISKAFKDCLIKESHKDTINSLYPKDDDVVAKVLSGEILLLPNNLYIWATMNTSDQSLFPIDSAFKRRWDWEYEPIKYKNINWVIDIEGSKYLWTSFQREINKRIFDATNSEDKMLGDYFVNPADGVLRAFNKTAADAPKSSLDLPVTISPVGSSIAAAGPSTSLAFVSAGAITGLSASVTDAFFIKSSSFITTSFEIVPFLWSQSAV